MYGCSKGSRRARDIARKEVRPVFPAIRQYANAASREHRDPFPHPVLEVNRVFVSDIIGIATDGVSRTRSFVQRQAQKNLKLSVRLPASACGLFDGQGQGYPDLERIHAHEAQTQRQPRSSECNTRQGRVGCWHHAAAITMPQTAAWLKVSVCVTGRYRLLNVCDRCCPGPGHWDKSYRHLPR
ncbi:hypothetical protein CALVIDRAFT_96894 [Calocera viscosa TUFC12733]|uniref:Uncharacterized protein n=1 Tax=Calocera viscosa (strain TUFC12733) TaxID=1330018 RepID=A0A167MZG2_CALVF|nr:hypothetical protein CALVIDRAFT_96894 [Calocera viscosa TUFC12733]